MPIKRVDQPVNGNPERIEAACRELAEALLELRKPYSAMPRVVIQSEDAWYELLKHPWPTLLDWDGGVRVEIGGIWFSRGGHHDEEE